MKRNVFPLWPTLATGLLVVGGILSGCGVVSSADEGGPLFEPGTTPDGGAGRGDLGTSSGGPAKVPAQELVPQTILVHASPDLPALRLCVAKGKSEPVPVANIMPRSNQVGVDVGGAAYLGDMRSTLVPAQQAYLVRTALTERRAKESDPPQRHESCEFYLSFPAEQGVDYWPVTLPQSLPATSLLVVTGCRNPTPTCPSPSLKVVPISATESFPGMTMGSFVPLADEVTGDVKVTVDGTVNGSGSGVVAGGKANLYEATPPRDMTLGAISNQIAFSASISLQRNGVDLLKGTLASLAASVDATTEPARYYGTRSLVVVALGSSVPSDEHPQRGLHLLALPLENVTTAVVDIDAGTPSTEVDAGSKTD